NFQILLTIFLILLLYCVQCIKTSVFLVVFINFFYFSLLPFQKYSTIIGILSMILKIPCFTFK
ncbi:hypothetical protein FVP35_00970, partial [Staphylococcus aureus]